MNSIAKAWKTLPWDGRGWSTPHDTSLGQLRHWAVRGFPKKFPAWSRPAILALNRGGWALASFWSVQKFGWAGEVFLDCLRSGAQPREVWLWRRLFPGSGPHPLGAPGKVLSRLGDPGQHWTLHDKVRTKELLSRAGLPVPETFDADCEDTWERPKALFVKPRFGCGSRGAKAVNVLGQGRFSIDSGLPVGAAILHELRRSLGPDLVVEERLRPAAELADLAANGAPPVLRITTAREAGGKPVLHSALLACYVPGERPHSFLRGQMRAAIDGRGRMRDGIWFASPADRFRHTPWNHAALRDRVIPGFDSAVSSVLSAMELFPDIPLVNWDLIVSPRGPVILEGNTGGDWILTNLAVASGLAPVALEPLLERWMIYSSRAVIKARA